MSEQRTVLRRSDKVGLPVVVVLALTFALGACGGEDGEDVAILPDDPYTAGRWADSLVDVFQAESTTMLDIVKEHRDAVLAYKDTGKDARGRQFFRVDSTKAKLTSCWIDLSWQKVQADHAIDMRLALEKRNIGLERFRILFAEWHQSWQEHIDCWRQAWDDPGFVDFRSLVAAQKDSMANEAAEARAARVAAEEAEDRRRREAWEAKEAVRLAEEAERNRISALRMRALRTKGEMAKQCRAESAKFSINSSADSHIDDPDRVITIRVDGAPAARVVGAFGKVPSKYEVLPGPWTEWLSEADLVSGGGTRIQSQGASGRTWSTVGSARYWRDKLRAAHEAPCREVANAWFAEADRLAQQGVEHPEPVR